MFREIEIKDNTQVEKINQLACQTPYEVWPVSYTHLTLPTIA